MEHPDDKYLLAAQGWLELGDHLEANEELEKISAVMRSHPDVLDIRWHIYDRSGRWDACVDIASKLVTLRPDRPENWIHRSFSLHAAKRTQEAFDNLLPAWQRFSDVWTIPYNLACYCSQLGRFDEAQDWFKKAILIEEKAVQKAGIDDPDLKPLWDSMSTTIWKQES